MNEEMVSLETNKTWRLVKRPKDMMVIGCKCVYRLKPRIPGVERHRHKSRLVAKGYSKREVLTSRKCSLRLSSTSLSGCCLQ